MLFVQVWYGNLKRNVTSFSPRLVDRVPRPKCSTWTRSHSSLSSSTLASGESRLIYILRFLGVPGSISVCRSIFWASGLSAYYGLRWRIVGLAKDWEAVNPILNLHIIPLPARVGLSVSCLKISHLIATFDHCTVNYIIVINKHSSKPTYLHPGRVTTREYLSTWVFSGSKPLLPYS